MLTLRKYYTNTVLIPQTLRTDHLVEHRFCNVEIHPSGRRGYANTMPYVEQPPYTLDTDPIRLFER